MSVSSSIYIYTTWWCAWDDGFYLQIFEIKIDDKIDKVSNHPGSIYHRELQSN